MESAKIQHWIPYTGLTVSLTLALIIGPRTAVYYTVVLGGSAAAALWLRRGMTMVREPDPPARRAAVYYACLLIHI
jgi:hypothetical protein